MTVAIPAPVTAPLEPTTPIKPSEALRLGRLVRPEPVEGQWFKGESQACALGAVHIGWGGDPIPEGRLVVNEDDQWSRTVCRLRELDADPGHMAQLFDIATSHGRDGDAAVLAFLEERGL